MALTRKDIEELELCLSISSGLSTQFKQQKLLRLFIAYRDGIPGSSGITELYSDDRKAEEYLAAALCIAPPVIPTSYWIGFLAKITSSRLAFVRIFRLHPVTFFAATTATGLLFKALQLSYFLEIAFCIGIVLEKSLKPQTSANEWWFQRMELGRAKQAIWNREFINTSSNAGVWGAVNAECYSASTLPMTTYQWNLAGFFFDIFHDSGISYLELRDYKNLKTKISDNTSVLGALHDDEKNILLANCEKKIKVSSFKWKRLTLVAIGIFAGMGLFYAASFLALPGTIASLIIAHPAWTLWLARLTPDALSVLKYAGSEFVILMGVFFGGLGARLFFSGLTWDKLTDPLSWFTQQSIKAFFENAFYNAGVPILTIVGLMSLTLVPLSVPTIVISASVAMLAVSLLMDHKATVDSFLVMLSYGLDLIKSCCYTPECTSKRIPAVVDALIEINNGLGYEGRLAIESMFNLLKDSQNFTDLQKYLEIDQISLVRVLKEWTKEKSARSPYAARIIEKIMDARTPLTTPLLERAPRRELAIDIPPQPPGDPIRTCSQEERIPSNPSTGMWCNLFKCCTSDSAIGAQTLSAPSSTVAGGRPLSTPHH